MQNLRAYQGTKPQLSDEVMIDPSSIVIGQVILHDHVSVWPMVVIRGDVNKVIIGKRSNIQDGSVLHVTHCSTQNPNGFPLLIGEQVTIGHKVMLHGCQIGDRVLIGMGSIVLDGAQIEDEVMVGAGSLVPPGKYLQSGYLYFGNPVKQIRRLTSEEILNLSRSAENYVRWKQDYLEASQK